MDATAGSPLAGLLVADFSRILAGPYASMLLGGPRRRRGQGRGAGRRRHPHLDAAGARTRCRPTSWASTATSAPSCSTSPTPPTVTWPPELAAPRRRADRELPPGGLARFGLDYDTVAAANPGVVYASISGFGTAEGAALPGYDLIVQAISGLMSLTGDPDGPPYRAGISVFDVMAGLHATIGVLAALHHRTDERPWPARRGQPDVLRAVRAGQPLERGRRRGRDAAADGQLAPEPVPVRRRCRPLTRS